MTTVCEWHKCGKAFTGAAHNARFCGSKCQASEANWRAMRGKPLVPLLILWRKSRNWSPSQKRQWEAATNRPVPTIATIARRVDAMILEQLEARKDA